MHSVAALTFTFLHFDIIFGLSNNQNIGKMAANTKWRKTKHREQAVSLFLENFGEKGKTSIGEIVDEKALGTKL